MTVLYVYAVGTCVCSLSGIPLSDSLLWCVFKSDPSLTAVCFTIEAFLLRNE